MQHLALEGRSRNDAGKAAIAAETGVAASIGHHVLCTVAEGSYFHGAAALANSAVASGFKGSFVIGCRGERPAWVADLEKVPGTDAYKVTEDVRLEFVKIDGPWHLANYKGHLVKRIFDELRPSPDVVYYLDTDIVLTHRWDIMAGWASDGVVVALDMADTYMSPHHIYRRAWKRLAENIVQECREFTGYVNSGCVGIHRDYAGFAEVWSLLMEELERDGADMSKIKNWAGKREFARMDQDVLNSTIMATDTPIALLGAEATGWYPGTGGIMAHAMVHRKPWLRNYVLDALRGFPPDQVHRAYWRFVDGPIRPFGRWEMKRKRAALKAARVIGFIRTRSLRDL
jgi:hypothetical protein